jgi:hypothetical protein
MARIQNPYASPEAGTATVATDGTVITVTGVLDASNCMEGDQFRDPDSGYTTPILERLDASSFAVPPYRGPALAAAAYEIYPYSTLRVSAGGNTAVVNTLIQRMKNKGIPLILPDGYADPTAAGWGADDLTVVVQGGTGKVWQMQGGAWVLIISPYGMQAGNAFSEIAAIGKQADARANLDMAAFGPAGVDLANGTDLNTITKNGVYRGNGLTNAVTANGSTIFVQALDAANFVYQRLSDHGSLLVWERWLSGGTWGAWARVAMTASSFGRVRHRVYSSSATYVPDPQMIYAIIECVGGGGGGGGVFSNGTNGLGGGGGGGGGYSRALVTRADVGSNVAVSIGAGGASLPGHGGAGGNTSFGAFCIALGGGFGHYNNGGAGGSGFYGQPGDGGGYGTGDFTASGSQGSQGILLSNVANQIALAGGRGGSSILGGGGAEAFTGYTPIAGGNGLSFGGGGAGAAVMAYPSSAATPGGAGAGGFCVVTEYCAII